MIKFIITILAIGIFAFFLQSFGPWWLGVIPAALGVIAVHFKPGRAFLAGFMGVGLAWGVQALVIDILNEGLLSARIGEMFGGIPGWSLVLVTAITGALLGGLGSATASAFVRWLIAK